MERDEDRITMIISAGAGERLRAFALRLEMPVSVLMRRWILERLEDEERSRDEKGSTPAA